jgi:hypothetical protein
LRVLNRREEWWSRAADEKMFRRDGNRIKVSLITMSHPNFGEVSEGMSQKLWSLAESEDKKVREFVQGGYGKICRRGRRVDWMGWWCV